MIIVLEGADATGKTTLAKALQKNLNASYLHATWNEELAKDMVEYHSSIVELAWERAKEGEIVIIDRLWLSEYIYGEAFRGGACNPYYGRLLERIINRVGGTNILCLDGQGHKERFITGKEKRKEMFSNMEKVAALYSAVYFGKYDKMEELSQGYLRTMIEQGGRFQLPNWVYYMIEDYGKDIDNFCLGVKARLDVVQKSLPPIVKNLSIRNGTGDFLTSDALFLGDKDVCNWPMHSIGQEGIQVLKFLENFRIHENRLFIININQKDGVEMAEAWIEFKRKHCPVKPLIVFVNEEAYNTFFEYVLKQEPNNDHPEFNFSTL